MIRILILDIYPKVNYRISKDQNGGYGTANDYGDSLLSKILKFVVKGSVGHMSAFMAQSGNLIILGDADEYLGDSIYEAKIYCLGKVKSLGADCIEKEMNEKEIKHLSSILKAQNIKADPKKFKRYGSARSLYNFKIDNVSSY